MRKSLLSVVILLALAAGYGCGKSQEPAAPAAAPEATESTMPATTDDAAMPADDSTEGSTMDSSTEAAPAGDAAPAEDSSK